MALQVDLTAIVRPNASDHLDQCRFTCAIVTDQANDFMRIDLKIHVRQRADCPEGLVDTPHTQAWFTDWYFLTNRRSVILDHVPSIEEFVAIRQLRGDIVIVYHLSAT